jgi:hypothetical protein
VIVRNDGVSTIRTRVYGAPEYRLIARVILEDGGVRDRWHGLPADLHPGDETRIPLGRIEHAKRIELIHALQEIPVVDPAPWAVADVR